MRTNTGLWWLLSAFFLFVAAVYQYAPNRPTARWRWISPGSIAATLVWLLGTLGTLIRHGRAIILHGRCLVLLGR